MRNLLCTLTDKSINGLVIQNASREDNLTTDISLCI